MKEMNTDTNNNIKAKCLGSTIWLNPILTVLTIFGVSEMVSKIQKKKEKKNFIPSKQ